MSWIVVFGIWIKNIIPNMLLFFPFKIKPLLLSHSSNPYPYLKQTICGETINSHKLSFNLKFWVCSSLLVARKLMWKCITGKKLSPSNYTIYKTGTYSQYQTSTPALPSPSAEMTGKGCTIKFLKLINLKCRFGWKKYSMES